MPSALNLKNHHYIQGHLDFLLLPCRPPGLQFCLLQVRPFTLIHYELIFVKTMPVSRFILLHVNVRVVSIKIIFYILDLYPLCYLCTILEIFAYPKVTKIFSCFISLILLFLHFSLWPPLS